MKTVHCNWKGPFNLATTEGRHAFAPPPESGIYLWCVGPHPTYRVSYVGEASNLNKRIHEHIFSMIGGRYVLYGDAHMIDCGAPVSEYKPGLENLLRVFLADFPKYSLLALHNLHAYSWFWASILESPVRKAVESAIITEARNGREPLQNERISLGSSNSPRLTIISSFEGGLQLAGIPGTIEYGALE